MTRAMLPSYTYELHAPTIRTIENAAIIVDTDHGWYQWSVAGSRCLRLR
jgi:hypothetical protein